MLHISYAQFDKLQASSDERFIVKLDAFLSRHLGEKYVHVADPVRLAYLRDVTDAARAVGVQSECHLYCYCVLSIAYGFDALTERLDQQASVESDGDYVQAVELLYDDLLQGAERQQ